jgi:signal peptidase I
MNPTLHIGDTFFSKKFAYGYSRYSMAELDLGFNGRILSLGNLPQRGDIVTFKLPSNTSIDYVKRIIGLPGDTVQMIDGRLYINDQIVDRKVVGSNQVEADDEVISVIDYLETLPGGVTHHIYEESDNQSLDNTQAYKVPEEHYFMMGDNRDNSADSRVMARVGFVPIENITGQAYRIYFRDNKPVWLSLKD